MLKSRASQGVDVVVVVIVFSYFLVAVLLPCFVLFSGAGGFSAIGGLLSSESIRDAFLDSATFALRFAIAVSLTAYFFAVSVEIRCKPRAKALVVLLSLLLFLIFDSPLRTILSAVSSRLQMEPSIWFSILPLWIKSFALFSLFIILSVSGGERLVEVSVNQGGSPSSFWRTTLLLRARNSLSLVFCLALIVGFGAAGETAIEVPDYRSLSDLLHSSMGDTDSRGRAFGLALYIFLASVLVLLLLTALLPKPHIGQDSGVLSATWWDACHRPWMLPVSVATPLALFAVVAVMLWQSRSASPELVAHSLLSERAVESIVASLATSLVALGIGAALAYRTTVRASRFGGAMVVIAILPLLLPAAPYAVAGAEVKKWAQSALGLDSMWLVWAYAFLFWKAFAISYLILLAAFNHGRGVLESAAVNLGASIWETFWRVTFPRTWPMIAAAWTLAFASQITDSEYSRYLSGSHSSLGTWLVDGMIYQNDPARWAVSAFLILSFGAALSVVVFAWARLSNRA